MMHKKKPASRRARELSADGTLRIGRNGIGYFRGDGAEEEIEIDPAYLNTALHGDRVRVRLDPVRREPQTGEVAAILSRAKERFVGTLKKENGVLFIDPDDRRMYTDIIIPEGKNKNARVGTKVVGKIGAWDDPKKNPVGEVARVLGAVGNNEVEMEAIVLDRGFASTFPEAAERAAQSLKRDAPRMFKTEEAMRRDLRAHTVFTIDPEDAKDFDDALSVRALPNGRFEVGVHIADPTFYVPRGSVLDREAALRGTSVYLVDRTIPMLPEVLSNDLCSLNPDEDKLSFSAIFELTADAAVTERWFGKTIIRSSKRFSYEEAQEALDSRRGPYVEQLLTLNRLSRALAKKRTDAGAIEFDQREVRFKLDSRGVPIGVYEKRRLATHKLIEQFMVLANNEVAHFMSTRDKKIDETFVYRVHDIPNEERMNEIVNLMHALGYDVPRGKTRWSARDVNALLQMAKGKAHEDIVELATIQAMAKAVYSTKNIGHFGLSLSHYTHFTSPIRRYPDMMAHRLLARYLAGARVPAGDLHEYEALSRYATEREIAAQDAERASQKFKHAEYMAKRVGTTYDGTITGFTEKGMFVRTEETLSEGMVRFRDIKDDYYMLDETTFSVVGQKKKRKFSLGDKVKIRVKNVNVEKRLIDFEFA
ncbi:MAG: ribonuclease R [Parcubacteria group bacterium]|nr:ribonuclease R [Parcubacteria group bacterium]